MESKFDVIIIGAGVSGCAIARELARKNRKTAVLEKASDVCEGTSKANSGIVHAGYDAKPGSLKAKLNIEGSKCMEALSKELDFTYQRDGSMVLCFEEEQKEGLKVLLKKGMDNGVEGLKILTGDQARDLEPHLSDRVVAALYAPTGAIVCPFGLTIALAENAAVNGVEFYLNNEVTDICKIEGGYRIKTNQGSYETRLVINAAGVYADQLHNMVSDHKLHIVPRRGEYLLLDNKVGDYVKRTLFQLPTALGKGILVTPTVHGNLLLGPTAEDISNKEGTDTTAVGMQTVIEKAGLSVKEVPARQVITSFAGLRAHEAGGDFVIEEVSDAPGFIDVAGIESPGLSSAPAIGVYVAKLVQTLLPAEDRADFIATRKGIPFLDHASLEEKQKLIEQDPAYANVICRCRHVTEGEIMAAIHRPLGATTTDGVKRRTFAGMGRCQSGFCAPKVVSILARELGIPENQVTKAGGASNCLVEDGI